MTNAPEGLEQDGERAFGEATVRRAGMIDSTQLLADRKLIHITHHGEIYSLRETRLGKLILTK